MWLVFLMLILLIGIVFSNIETNLYNINISEKNANFKVTISLKLFGILTILVFDLDRFGLKFFNKKIPYNKFIKKKSIKEINKKDFFYFIKKLNIKINRIYFNLKVGLIDIYLTNIVIVLFSSIFSNLAKNKIEKNKIKYEILPEYNKFWLNLKGKISISVNILNLTKLYFQNIKSQITHNRIKNYKEKESLKYE